MWVTPEMFLTIKSLAGCGGLRAELSVDFLEGGLIVWHFPLCVSYRVSRNSQCQVAQATLLKTQEGLKRGTPEIQQFCFVD